MAIIVTPTSANTADHIEANPAAINAIQILVKDRYLYKTNRKLPFLL